MWIKIKGPVYSDDKSANLLIPEGTYWWERSRAPHGRQIKDVLHGKIRRYVILAYRIPALISSGYIKELPTLADEHDQEHKTKPQPTNLLSITTHKETASFVEKTLQSMLDDGYWPHDHERQYVAGFLADLGNAVEEWCF